MRFLSKVEDVFEISGRGCVLTPGISDATPADIRFTASDPIQLRRPDGSVIRTHIHEIAALDKAGGRSRYPVLLPPEFSKADIPIGTEIWLEKI